MCGGGGRVLHRICKPKSKESTVVIPCLWLTGWRRLWGVRLDVCWDGGHGNGRLVGGGVGQGTWRGLLWGGVDVEWIWAMREVHMWYREHGRLQDVWVLWCGEWCVGGMYDVCGLV